MLSVLGPTRKANQVELSFTDARVLGLKNVPVRESGDVAGTPGVKMVGPAGEIEISEGCIIAKRHIHFTPEEAAEAGVSDKEIVKVKVTSDRTTIFDDVVVRVHPNFAAAMHIDTDEANASCAFGEVYGEIVK
jgi:putative phosphotransacetylase